MQIGAILDRARVEIPVLKVDPSNSRRTIAQTGPVEALRTSGPNRARRPNR
jgi:hypothetical protein